MRRVAGVIVAVALAGVAACGPGPNETGPTPPAPSVPPEALVLRPDGTVPWVDEPITDEQLRGAPPPPRTPARGSEPCRAEQLAGRLERWTRPSNGGETPRGWDAAGGKLIGYAEVRNTSTAECTLRGEVPTRLLAGGREVPMRYAHGINAEARRRVIVVPAGGRADLRLDWSGPFCEQISGPLELAIELPNGGGTLRAPVSPAETPGCARGEAVNPNVRGTLYASGFGEPAQPPPPNDSPLHGVTVAISGPRTARPGEQVTYHVVLANPTNAAIPLDPCPGYLVELFSMGDMTNQPVNTGQLYRLNCRPVAAVAAGGEIRFEMVARVPAELSAGRDLTVTWRLAARGFVQGPKHWGQITLRVA
ncbi:hypothetical protein WEI85_36740 [Actinomycetes bacterium KLBMP 9797]